MKIFESPAGYLTVLQLKNACKDYPYILARFSSGHLMGINTKVADLILKKTAYNDRSLTDYVGFKSCDFQTYISHKHGFL